MDVAIESKNEIVIITVTGSIDSNTAAEFSSQIMDKISNAQNVLLDLSNVDFVSSAGLRVLLMIYRQIKAKNGKVVIAGVSEDIKDVMAMTGFIHFFELADSTASAQNLFNV